MQLDKEGLREILKVLVTASDGEEEVQLRKFIEELNSDVRDLLIDIRNQALEQAEFGWSVELSHFIYACSEPSFWDGETILPPTN